MARTVLLRLVDMRDALAGIQDVVAGQSYDAFATSWAAQRAVERGLEIISEASRHVPPDLKAHAVDIPWRQIAAIGNLLRHEYQRADPKAIWNIVQVHLPRLEPVVAHLIATVSDRLDAQP